MAAKVGVICGLTTMPMVAVVAHTPAVGVKVYTVVPAVVVLMVVFHVPVMGGTFVEVNGNSGGTEFWHKGPMAVKVGVIFGFTVTVTLAVPVQPATVPVTV
jgi:hypothetical protein